MESQATNGTDRQAEAQTETIAQRAARRVGRFICGLSGHDAVLHFEGRRVNMRCTSCGHDTPGWETSARAPRQRFEGDARRHALVPKRLIRKIA